MTDKTEASLKLATKQREEREALDREYAVREILPAGAEPYQVYTGTRLYGCDASVKYGQAYRYSSLDEDPRYKVRTLDEARALLAELGTIVPIWSVLDGGIRALKPEDAITAKERERAEIEGPYACKIETAQEEGAHLGAFIEAEGLRFDVDIHLLPHEPRHGAYGRWDRVGGHEHYSESWRFEARPAALHQAKLVRYASGSQQGPRSGGRLVYLFEHPDQIYLEPVSSEARP